MRRKQRLHKWEDPITESGWPTVGSKKFDYNHHSSHRESSSAINALVTEAQKDQIRSYLQNSHEDSRFLPVHFDIESVNGYFASTLYRRDVFTVQWRRVRRAVNTELIDALKGNL
jgi:hypothetical protein